MLDFHETRFPLDVSLNGRGGPERRTDVVTLGSNREARNARWAHSRRRYEAGYGVKSLAQLAAVIEFFEERRGRLIGFRWRDRADLSSARLGGAPSPLDQSLGAGDGATAQFQLLKTYGTSFAPYARAIAKPVIESVRDEWARDLRAVGCSCERGGCDGGIFLRCARALRHGLSRDRRLFLRGRRDSENSDHRNHSVKESRDAFRIDIHAGASRRLGFDHVQLLASRAQGWDDHGIYRS